MMLGQVDIAEPQPVSQPSLTPVPVGPLVVPTRPDPRWGPPVRLSLVIPTYNESENVREIVRQLTWLLEEPLGGSYELIVVDDDSPDRTWAIAEGLMKEYPRLRVLRRQTERGLSTAVVRGWQAARGEVLAVIDADLQHPPEVTLGLWREIEAGADLATGSRHVEGGGVSDWAVHRRVLSRGAQMLGLFILPSVVGRVSDPMSGYFMLRRAAIAGRRMNPLGYKILIEVIARGRIRWIGEVGYVFRERTEGKSKVTTTQYVDYLRHLIRLRIDTQHLTRFLKFAVVGLSGVIVDMTLLYCFQDSHMLGMALTRSKCLAAEVAIANNFLWNDTWTFRDRTRDQPGLLQKVRRFVKFNVVCGFGVLLNVLLLNVLCYFFGVNVYLANAGAIALVTVWNYWLNTSLSWRTADVDGRDQPEPHSLPNANSTEADSKIA